MAFHAMGKTSSIDATHSHMAKSALSFVGQNCGASYNRWQGTCEACGEWNALAEEDTTGATTMPASIRLSQGALRKVQ
jgi:predicted ATP-dependent serine protease